MLHVSRSTGVLLAIGAASVALGAWLATPPSDIDAYARGAPERWAYLRQLEEQHPDLAVRHPYVPLSRISVDLQLAVIAGEDAAFLGHGAFDTGEMREALYQWVHGGRLRGASTITQQLAKNLFLSDARSIVRKLREARYAYWLEKRLGKRRILELYLNLVELGEGTLGVDSGARLYFGLPAASLDARRAAELAAAIPAPLKSNPATRSAAWRARYAAIIDRMQRFGWLRQELLALNGVRPLLAGGGAAAHAAPPPEPTDADAHGPVVVPETDANEPEAPAPEQVPTTTEDTPPEPLPEGAKPLEPAPGDAGPGEALQPPD